MTMVRNGGYEGTGPPEAHRVVPLKRAASLKALKRQYLEIYHRECGISEAIFGILVTFPIL